MVIMEAESVRPIGLAAEYGACITSFEQRGCVIVSVCMYHCIICMYSTILFHSIYAEFMHVLECIVQNIQTSGYGELLFINIQLKPK